MINLYKWFQKNLETSSKFFLLIFYSKEQPSGLERNSLEKAIYTPSCMFMRDDEMYNSSVGVFYDAPDWKHEDYYTFMLLERMIGHY